jgi:uncharacterized membrane protein
LYGPGGYGGADGNGRTTRQWVALGAGLAIIAVVVILLVLLYTGVLSTASGGPRPYFGFWGGFFLLFVLVWVSFFILRVAFWTSRSQRGYYAHPGRVRDPAVMAARQRYARGEITREQYDQIMTDLGRRGRGPGGPLSGA